MARFFRILLLGLVFLVVLSLILAPGVARKYAVKNSHALVGRSIEVEKLRVNYMTGKIRVFNFTLFESDNVNPFVSFDTLIIDMRPLNLIRKNLYLQQFYLSGLQASVVHTDTLFNFSDLATRFEKDDLSGEDPEDQKEDMSLAYHLYDTELHNARFTYENKDVGDTLFLRNISFNIPYLGWDQDHKSEAGLRLNLRRDASLEATMNIHPVEGDFDMNLALNGMELEGFSKVLSTYSQLDSISGKLNTSIEIQGNINTPERSVLAGNLDIADLSLSDEGRRIVGSRSIHLDVAEADLFRSRFLIDSLILDEPYLYFELKDSTSNLQELLTQSEQLPPSGTDSSEYPDTTGGLPPGDLYYAIKGFRFMNGTVDFMDASKGEPFSYHLSRIEIVNDSLQSTAEQASILASMILNERGRLMAETRFNPMDPSNFVLDFTLADFQLKDLNIYSRHYMGFPVLYGEMFYKGHTEIRNNELVSSNQLVIDNVELGEKNGGIVDLPLRFALYILKDRNNVVNLEIPVEGRTDDPQVSVGQIVWNTLRNLIIRTATAPYDFLAQTLGVDPGDIKDIEFSFGDTALTPGIRRQLDLLVELESVKPAMEIELLYYNDPQQEREYLFQQMNDLTTEGADSLMLLNTRTRIRLVNDYLHTASDSTQITLSRSDPRAPQNVGSIPRFIMKYSLKDDYLAE
jgi:hypothetical protein